MTCTYPSYTFSAPFDAELNIASRTPRPTTADVGHLVGNATIGARTWTWDLGDPP